MRVIQKLCDEWKFHRGDIKVHRSNQKGPMYVQAKTERYKSGPAAIHYNDDIDSYPADGFFPTEDWEYVRLPHDYVVNGTPSKDENCTLGYLKYDNAWYRKHFSLSSEDMDKRIVLKFDGVSGNSTVYLNGCLVNRNFCGYTSFVVDITDFAVYDRENILAVYINLEENEGWWYEGGGIYRDVWLIKTDAVSIDTYGVYINPKKISDTQWTAELEATVINVSDKDESVSIATEIIDNDGRVVSLANCSFFVPSRQRVTEQYSCDVISPVLWDIDNPYLYQVKTTVFKNGVPCDTDYTRTGFRYFECDANEGFLLNGKHVKIKGVCAHEDCGLLGKAVPKNVHRYKMEMLKEMGANGYRTSHYQQSSAILDALDELGFIVLNEARWFSSTDEGISQLEELVKRDRNRPSVFFWSVSNEEYLTSSYQGKRITTSLTRAIMRLDKSRPITMAVDKSPKESTVFDGIDIVGLNYNIDVFDEIHKSYPDKPTLSTENCATGSSRSWYYPDSKELGLLSSYDKDTNNWFRGREYTWKFISERDFIMGGYQWAGFEHRGETVWPRLCSQSGAIDMFLQRKDAFYQNQSHWSEKPCIHILPHWNIEDYGKPISVWAYTNCDEAELFLNGKSLGRKKVEKNTHIEWLVPYEKGEIKAVGYIDNQACVVDTHITAGDAEKLVLRLENKVQSPDDVAIITCYCVDKDGLFVPNASPLVSFHSNGFGRIIATGSDICDHTPQNSPTRKMREGYISVAAGVGVSYGKHVAKKGTIEVYATSPGLKGAKLKIEI